MNGLGDSGWLWKRAVLLFRQQRPRSLRVCVGGRSLEKTERREEECVCRFVFSKGSDYVIYSQCLAQLQESDPLHTLLSLTPCGMWSHSASRWQAYLGMRFPALELMVKGSTSNNDCHSPVLFYSSGNSVYRLWGSVFSHSSLQSRSMVC